MFIKSDTLKHYFESYAECQVCINFGKFWQSVPEVLMVDVDKANKIYHTKMMFK